jgi:IPT/TIG domain
MPGNPTGNQDVACSLFLGRNVELEPSDLPEGVSPANQECAYVPGSVFSRACFHKLLTPADSTSTVVYSKTYVQPNGQPLTLILYSNGKLYKEDPIGNPGVLVQIGSVVPGSYCFSVTAGGREWMAFSDGLHGTDIPRSFDGTNFDRVSQDGPGAGAQAVADINTQSAVSSVVLSNIAAVASATEAGNVVTITTAAPHGLTETAGFVLLYGIVVAGYNGLFQIGTIPSATTFTVVNAGTGLAAAGAGGNVGFGTVTVTTATAHGLNPGDAVVLGGTASSLDNGANQTSNIPAPPFWDVVQVTSSTVFLFSLVGLRGQGALNSTTINGGGAGGNAQTGGMISVGTHQLVVIFQTRTGFQTAPSPMISWTCAGQKQATVTGIPIGPSNVVARILALTGSGGSSFFYIPDNTQIPGSSLLFNGGLAPSTIVKSTIIPDNTTTSFTLDFPDNTLFAGTPIDVDGNNLFNQVVLGPCLGFFSYASRLLAWGERNKVQNLLNMGFEGGFYSGAPTVPLGWTVVGAGGALVTNPVNFGEAWQVTGAGAGVRGKLQQTAYQDEEFVAIIDPSTQYTFRCWAEASAGGLTGNLLAILSSVSAGFTSTATIPANTIPTGGGFVQANFSLATPAVIPSDLLFIIETSNLTNAATVTVDEMEIIFTANPFLDTIARASYVSPPGSLESFDGVTGKIGSSSDPTPIRGFGIVRDTLGLITAERLHRTQDNDGEPRTWSVPQVAASCGAFSPFAITGAQEGSGEDWIMWAGPYGLRIWEGDTPWKLSQEIQPDWDSINQAAQQSVWLENDPVARRVYIGAPLLGTVVNVAGTGFGASQGTSTITFAGLLCSVILWSDTNIFAILPTSHASSIIVVTVAGQSTSIPYEAI